MKSKIHFFAIFFSIVTLLLAIPCFIMAKNGWNNFLQNPANIFFVLISFFGLLGITFMFFGIKNLKQVSISENLLSEKWLGILNLKKIELTEEAFFMTKSYHYGFFRIQKTIVEDAKGNQVKFNNWDFRNYKQLTENINKKLIEKKIQPKTALIDKVFMWLFSLLTIWMIVSSSLGIIF